MKKLSFHDPKYSNISPSYNAYYYGKAVGHNDNGERERAPGREQFQTQEEWEGYCDGFRDAVHEDRINAEDFAEMDVS